MTNPPRAGLVGGGVIGAGWAARLVLNGYDVAIFDPDPEIGRKRLSGRASGDRPRRPEYRERGAGRRRVAAP